MDSAERTRGLLDRMFTTDAMLTVFSDYGRIQGMLTFEAALARACERVGVIPEGAAVTIASHCDARDYSLVELARDATLSGNLAIPLIKALTKHVMRDSETAAGYVHWGATSQDVIDTGLVLQMRDGLALIEDGLARLERAFRHLASEHTATLQVGRTWMQQAAPTTFGLKVAGWLSAIKRDQERLREARPRALALQLGGAVGTLAAFGDKGLDIMRSLAEELDLDTPDMPWHTQRDRVTEIATTLGLLMGTLGKVARDVSMMAQSEVAEVAEPSILERGGSSTMPQKRNPVGAAATLAAAQRVPGLVATMLAAMPQEYERGLGGWQAEWEVLPEIFLLIAGALRTVTEVAERLEVNVERMRANLDATHGLLFAEAVSFALAPSLGRRRAHDLVHTATMRLSAQRPELRDALGDDEEITGRLSSADLDRLFDPRHATGMAEELIKRVLDG